MVMRSGERLTRIHELDLQHNKNIHKTDLILRDEESRLLQLRLLASQNEIATLKNISAEKDAEVFSSSRQHREALCELDKSRALVRSHEAQLRTQNDEIYSLKAKIIALNATTQEIDKAVEESLALAIDANRMRLEIETLRTELANHQAILGENIKLQQQLNASEVELENEKLSRSRDRSKDDDIALAELKFKLEICETQLTDEKAERVAVETKHVRELAEAHNRCEILEAKSSAMRSKSKSIYDELKETRAELLACQMSLQRAQVALQCLKEPARVKPSSKSRPIQQQNTDQMAIQTPGNVDIVRKKPLRRRLVEHAPVGEKSNFSITPFLNRAKSFPDGLFEESPPTQASPATRNSGILPAGNLMDSSIQHATEKYQDKPTTSQLDARLVTEPVKKPRGRPRLKPLAEALASETIMAVPPIQEQGGDKTTVLEVVLEEPCIEAGESKARRPKINHKICGLEVRPVETCIAITNSDVSVVDSKKKKKRKLLGGNIQTLFEDGEGETSQQLTKTSLGPIRKLKAPLGGGTNAFSAAVGSFSPLKRDRRGVNASFLA